MIPFISNLLERPVTRKEVLERVKKIKIRGLCHSISYVLNEYNILNDLHFLYIWFPKFVKENALQFGADKYSDWWWKCDVWDTGRMDFLNWLIEQYKDDKTDLRKL
jgi:hypothetical protein